MLRTNPTTNAWKRANFIRQNRSNNCLRMHVCSYGNDLATPYICQKRPLLQWFFRCFGVIISSCFSVSGHEWARLSYWWRLACILPLVGVPVASRVCWYQTAGTWSPCVPGLPGWKKKIEQTRKYCHRNLLKLITYKYADLKDRRSKVIQHKNIFQRPTPISSI